MASRPAWLDEGLAQYYEFGSPDPALDRAARAARQGTLLPLASLSGGFGRAPEQVRLSYDQSLSAVTYLLETWGDPGFRKLLTAFRQGKWPRAAVQEVLGITWEEFEAGWIAWLADADAQGCHVGDPSTDSIGDEGLDGHTRTAKDRALSREVIAYSCRDGHERAISSAVRRDHVCPAPVRCHGAATVYLPGS